MMGHWNRIGFAVLLAVAGLAGCGSSPTAKFYTLEPPATATRVESTNAYTVAIGAVLVPDALNRPQIVTRSGDNQVTINEFERWAGPLNNEIAGAIAANLTQLLPGATVFTYPQGTGIEAQYRVAVELRRFDSVPGGAVDVEVFWVVQPATGTAKSGRSVVHEATNAPGFDALIAAHGRALASVSKDIATAVRAVRQ